MKILNILSTPNPASIKFVMDTNLTPISEIISAEKAKTSSSSPLVADILGIESVKSIMIQGSWVTVSFNNPDLAGDRDEQKKVAAFLRSYDNESLSTDNQPVSAGVDEDPMLIIIRDVVQEKILPYLNSHGGSVEVVDLVANQVFIRYIGACGGCPASTNATLQGIESLLRSEVDPELEVVLVL